MWESSRLLTQTEKHREHDILSGCCRVIVLWPQLETWTSWFLRWVESFVHQANIKTYFSTGPLRKCQGSGVVPLHFAKWETGNVRQGKKESVAVMGRKKGARSADTEVRNLEEEKAEERGRRAIKHCPPVSSPWQLCVWSCSNTAPNAASGIVEDFQSRSSHLSSKRLTTGTETSVSLAAWWTSWATLWGLQAPLSKKTVVGAGELCSSGCVQMESCKMSFGGNMISCLKEMFSQQYQTDIREAFISCVTSLSAKVLASKFYLGWS